MATDNRRVEWPPSRKHLILIRLTLLWQQVRNVISWARSVSSRLGLCFSCRESRGLGSSDARMPELTAIKVFLLWCLLSSSVNSNFILDSRCWNKSKPKP